MAATTTTAWTAARTLDALKRHNGFSDQRIADLVPGYSRDMVSERRRGVTALDYNDMDAFGRLFGVPSTVFLMSASDALRYVLDNDVQPNTTPPDLGNPGSSCYALTAA